MPLPMAQGIKGGVTGDLKQPGGKPVAGLSKGKPVEIPVRPDEGFLRDILRPDGVTGQPIDKIKDRPLIAADQFSKRLLVPRLCPTDAFPIQLLGIRHIRLATLDY